LHEFIVDRLRAYYADVPPQQFEAVAALRPVSLLDFDRRLKAIGTFAALPEAEALAAANKRIRNILRKSEDDVPATSMRRVSPKRPSAIWATPWTRRFRTRMHRSPHAITSRCWVAWRACGRRWTRSSTASW
jgi:hypothetical protein